MAARDEDALVCDMAETYHIYDYTAIPCRLAATLAAGLHPESRSMMALAGTTVPTSLYLQAVIADRLGMIFWAQTKDGQKGRNRPESIAAALRGENKKEQLETFCSGAAFEAVRANILKRIEVDQWQQ